MHGGDLTISSTRVVAGGTVRPGTVVARDGRIVGVQERAHGHAAGVDVGDAVVMPGVVDTHVHVNEPGRTEWEGFDSATRAAAAGGVTTIVAMPLNCEPAATSLETLRGEIAAAEGKCLVDYGFWGGVVPGNEGTLEGQWREGALGFKCFLSPSGIDDFENVGEGDLRRAMPTLARLGAVLLAHAEDPSVLAAAASRSGLDRRPRSYDAWLASRPAEAEEVAIALLLRLCEEYRGPVHIVHLAAPSALPMLRSARRQGLPVSVETCPHYLWLAAEEIQEGRTEFKCAPPIRGRAEREGLWRGLGEGLIDLIASDHSPCPPEMKLLEAGDFARAWGGVSSLQLALPLVWTGASRRGFGLADVARWMCESPARLAGLHARKGRIAPGYDADLVILDPEAEFVVEPSRLHHRHTLTPYTGSTLRGVVRATYSRGRKVFDGGGFAPEAGGRWLKRS